MKQQEAKFSLGKVVSTVGAFVTLEFAEADAQKYLRRHESGDWGDVSSLDWEENEFSLKNGFRLLSAYYVRDGEVIWIITEADRSVTTILLPEEY